MLITIVSIFLLTMAPLRIEARTASGNFSDDLQGVVDTRPGTWGTADAAYHSVTFNPPRGCRVKIYTVWGDLVAWTRRRSTGKVGVLVGMYRTPEPDENPWADCDWCDGRVFLYHQLGVGTEQPETLIFRRKFRGGVMLGPDHKITLKHAVWLNETGQPVHMETTWTIEYEFVCGSKRR